MPQLPLFAILGAVIIVLLYHTIKILKEYERGVIFLPGTS